MSKKGHCFKLPPCEYVRRLKIIIIIIMFSKGRYFTSSKNSKRLLHEIDRLKLPKMNYMLQILYCWRRIGADLIDKLGDRGISFTCSKYLYFTQCQNLILSWNLDSEISSYRTFSTTCNVGAFAKNTRVFPTESLVLGAWR